MYIAWLRRKIYFLTKVKWLFQICFLSFWIIKMESFSLGVKKQMQILGPERNFIDRQLSVAQGMSETSLQKEMAIVVKNASLTTLTLVNVKDTWRKIFTTINYPYPFLTDACWIARKQIEKTIMNWSSHDCPNEVRLKIFKFFISL